MAEDDNGVLEDLSDALETVFFTFLLRCTKNSRLDRFFDRSQSWKLGIEHLLAEGSPVLTPVTRRSETSLSCDKTCDQPDKVAKILN